MDIILIHGALGTAAEMKPVGHLLEADFSVHYYEIPGHGSRADEKESYTIQGVLADFKNYLNTFQSVYVFGFSLGGYLALMAAQQGEERIKGIVTLGTKLNWSKEEAEKEVGNLSMDFLKVKAEVFFNYLAELHGEQLESLCDATAKFMLELGSDPQLTPESVAAISIPVRMGRGGKDRMVDAISTQEIVDAIPHGVYWEIPSWPHPIGFLNPKHVARFVGIQLSSFSYEFAETPAGQLAFKRIGTPQAGEPILLFLHEGLGSIAQWGDFPEQLCETMKLSGVLYERGGYGFSHAVAKGRTDKYLHEFAWNELPAFIDAINLPNPFILIGHSDGGSIALLYAAKYPERLAGLVTMAAHIYNEEITVEGIVEAREAWIQGKLKGLELFHGQKTEKVFFDWNDTWQTPDFLKWNIEQDCCTQIDFPALIIQGETDQYGSPEQVRDIVSILGEEAEGVLIPDAGHSPHLDAKDSVIAEIVDYFTSDEE